MRRQEFEIGMLLLAIGLLVCGPSVHAATPIALNPLVEYTNTGNVNDILLSENQVWIATDGGLVSYHRQHMTEQARITSKDGLFGNALRTLALMAEDTMMVGGDFGQARIDIGGNIDGTPSRAVTAQKRHSMKLFDPVVAYLNIDNVLFALQFQSGLTPVAPANKTGAINPGKAFWNTGAASGHMLALGAADGTFVQFDITQRRVVHTLRFVTPIIKVVPYKKGFLIATQRHLYTCVDGIAHPVRDATDKHSSEIQATSIAPATTRNVFIGTADGRVLELNEGSVQTVATFNGHRITAMAPDNGHLWLGISQKGLVRYTVASGKTVVLRDATEICANHVTQTVYHKDTLVVRTFDNGACYLSKQGWRSLPAGKSRYVHGLASDGHTLVVTDSDGITLYDETLQPIDASLYLTGAMRWLGKSAALSVVSPRKGLFFIASPFGMARLEQIHGKYKTTFWKKKRGIPGDITALAADDAQLYIGTESRGVRVFTHAGKFVADYLDPTHLPESWTMALSVLNASLVVGTCQHGVAIITGDSPAVFHNAATGLADNRIIATEPFRNGVFIGSLHGLSYIDIGNGDFHLERIFSPDPRSASLYVHDQTLFYSTEYGLVGYKIISDE